MKKHTMITKTIQTALLSIGLLTSYGLFSADESTIVNGQLIKTDQIETVENESVESNETIAEQFVITSVENGILRGELIDGNGEGIYYELNDKELKKYPAFYEVDVNDLIMIEWTKDNYNDGQWTDIVKASYNKQGNKEL